MNGLRIFLSLALIIILQLTSFPFFHGQPQGYTLIYSPSRAYYVDWMDVKAIYMKTEGNRLYFYIEYYGAMPSSRDYERGMEIYMDTDRNPQTGQVHEGLGVDYFFYFVLRGDNSSCQAPLLKWHSNSWEFIKDLKTSMRLAPGLSYMEIWVDQEDIWYTQYGIDFYIRSHSSVVEAIPRTELTYVIGSSKKEITVDGESGDWSTINPLVIFPSRSINPPELEISSIYVANDDENLYFRFDARGKPTTTVSEGNLFRWFNVFLDMDYNNNTGDIEYGGAEFKVYTTFDARPSKHTEISYEKHTGTGWSQLESPSNFLDFNNVFELKIPLSLLGLTPGRTVGIYVAGESSLYRRIPESDHLTYHPPDNTPPTISDASPTGTVGSTSVTFTVKVEDAGSGVKEVKLIVDGASQGAMSQSGNTYTKTLSLSEGSHTWIIEAVDNMGNAATQNYSLTIAKGLPIETYLAIATTIIVIIVATAIIMLRRRHAPLPPPPPPPP